MPHRPAKITSFLLCFLLIFEQSGFAQVAGQLDISGHILSLRNSLIQDKFRPLHLRYLSYDNINNNFKLLLDKGTVPKEQDLEGATKTLLNYFFVGIALPNDSFWVNLRPDSPDNIIDSALASTDVGKILLEADLQLKKDTAKFTSPQTPEGKKYWDKLYQKAGELFGTSNITIPTLTRPWIVPGEIIIREAEDNAYIYKATLKVCLEQDYLKDSATYNFKDERLKQLNEYSSQIIRELIIPKLTKEVNNAKRYASLRQVYYSLILAQWFKQKFYGKGGLYSWLIDKQNLNGLTSKTAWSKTTYFKEYQKSFKDGEYNLKEPISTPYGQAVRSYFSGGISFGGNTMLPVIAAGTIQGNPKKSISSPADPKIISLELKGGTIDNPASAEVLNVKIKEDKAGSQEGASSRDSANIGSGQSKGKAGKEQAKQEESKLKKPSSFRSILRNIILTTVILNFFALGNPVFAAATHTPQKISQVEKEKDVNHKVQEILHNIDPATVEGEDITEYSSKLSDLGESAVPYLIDELKNNKNEFIRQIIRTALRKAYFRVDNVNTTKQIIDIYLKLLQDKSVLIRRQAAGMLTSINGYKYLVDAKEFIPAIAKALKDEDAKVRGNSIDTLNLTLTTLFAKVYYTKDHYVKGEYIYKAIDILVEAIEDTDLRVRSKALASLEGICGIFEDIGYPIPQEIIFALIKGLEKMEERKFDVDETLAIIDFVLKNGQKIPKNIEEALRRLSYRYKNQDVGVKKWHEESPVSTKDILLIYKNKEFWHKTKNLSVSNRFSVASAIGYTLKRFDVIINDENITKVLPFILTIREKYSSRVILNEDTNLIIACNEEDMFSPLAIIKFAKIFDVRKSKTFKAYMDKPQAPYSNYVVKDELNKEPGLVKSNFIKSVENSPWDTTVWFNGHGGPQHFWFTSGQHGKEVSNDLYRPDAISYKELSEALIKRAKSHNGQLSDLTIIVDSCYSANFIVSTLNSLTEACNNGEIKDLPIIITAANRGNYAYGSVLLNSVKNVLSVPYGQFLPALFLSDIYKAEEMAANYEDFAFFLPLSREELRELASMRRLGKEKSKKYSIISAPLRQREELAKNNSEIGSDKIVDNYISSSLPIIDGQIGKRGQLVSIDLKKNEAKVRDSVGAVHTISLTPQGRLDVAPVKSQIETMQDIEQNYKKIIFEILSLLEKSPPILYTFAPLVEDFLGFASKKDNLIAIHQSFLNNPIAIFHEIGEYLVQSGALNLTLVGNTLNISVNGQQFSLILQGETLAIAQKDSANPHYLLRALQREMFGEKDRVLTQEIKKKQNTPFHIAASLAAFKNNLADKMRQLSERFSKKARLHKQLIRALRNNKQYEIRRILEEIFNERYKGYRPLTDEALSIYQSHPMGFIRFIEEGVDLTKEVEKDHSYIISDFTVAEQARELIEVFEISRDKGNQLLQIRNNETEYRHKLLEVRLEKEYADIGIQLSQFAKKVNWDEYYVQRVVSLAKRNKLNISTILGWFESAHSKGQSLEELESDLDFSYKTARLLLEHNVYDHKIISTAEKVIEVENSNFPEEIKHPLQSLDENQRLRLVLVLTGVSSLDSELATKLFSMVLEWKQQRLAERHSYAGQVDYRIRIIGEIEKALLERVDLVKPEKLLKFSKDYEEKYRVESGHARDGIWEAIEFVYEMISKSDKATLSWLKGKINDKGEISSRVIKQYMFLHSEWHREVLEAIKSRSQCTDSFIVEGTQRSSSGFLSNLDTILGVFNPAIASYSRDVKTILSTPILGSTILMTESILSGSINDIIKDSQGNVYRLMEDIVDNKYLSTDFKIRLLQSSPTDIIAKALKINIKLARYLRERNINLQLLERLSEPGFKEEINEISYNLNREVTLHPVERRVGEDEKTSLFDLLFSLNPEEIVRAKKLFDTYFRNNPDKYRIDISKLNELLRYVGTDDIKKIIRSVVDDPKQSLDELIHNIKQQVQGQPNADFVVRNVEWLLSNLFVLQDKVEQLEPLSEALQAQGRSIEDIKGILEQIDKIKKFSVLNDIATSNNLNVIDLLRLKLESISQEAREDVLVDVLQAVDSLPNEQQKTILLGELSAQFSYQPIESQTRIYLKLLFNQGTDNSVVLKAVRELGSGDEISGFKKAPAMKQFIILHRNLIMENMVLHKYLEETQKLEGENQQKETLKQLRSLYQDRRYASSKFASEYLMSLKEYIEALYLQILLPKPIMQIPHVFYEPLLRIKPTAQALDTLRELIVSMNANKGMRDQLATLKNNLNEKIVLFSTFDYNQKDKLFSKLLTEALAKKYPSISIENASSFYDDLMFYLEQYSTVIDSYLKAKANLFPAHINETLGNTSEAVINKLLFDGEIDEVQLKKLVEDLAAIETDVLFARFKATNIQIENETDLLERLKHYATYNSRFQWRDHEGRNIYRLIDIYLRNIKDQEIYKNILEALTAEIDGRFSEWKYESEDYKNTIDEIVELESKNLSEEEQKIIKKLRESAKKEGKTLYEVLQKIVGFEELKARIEKIKNWEKTAQNISGDGLIAEFADDFYTLFNIGNYSGSTACQSSIYGSDLNRGLTGYVVNGTNKAVVLLDANRQVITRRIVRLRLLEHEENGVKKRQPVIFVEESTQFGVRGIDELYALLDAVSQDTGLPIVASQHRPAQSSKVNEGTIKNYNIELYRARSEFDYSDLYGHSVPEALFAGLYIQKEPKLIVGPFGLLVKPKAEFDLSAAKTEMSTVSLGAQVSHIKMLDNLLRILNVLRKSKNVPEIAESASDREIIEFCINELRSQGLIEETVDKYGNRIIKIKKEAEDNRSAQAIREWAINPEGGAKAINFQSSDDKWNIVGFEAELNNEDTLEHEQKEIAYRKQGYSWIKAHNMAGGRIIDEEDAKEYKAGRQDEIGAGDEVTGLKKLISLLKGVLNPSGKHKTYGAITDAHGSRTFIKWLKEILTKTDMVVFTGDMMDRGDANIEVYNALKEAVAGGKVIPLWGNHDNFFVLAMLGDDSAMDIWLSNGGYKVLEELGLLQKDYPRIRLHSKLQEIANWMIDNFQLYYIDPHGTLYLHAGIPLDNKGNVKLEYKGYKGLLALALMEQEMKDALRDRDWHAPIWGELSGKEKLLWARDWIGIAEYMAGAERIVNELGVARIVFGHTRQDEALNIGNRIFGIDRKMFGGEGGIFVNGDERVALDTYAGGKREIPFLSLSSEARQELEKILREIDRQNIPEAEKRDGKGNKKEMENQWVPSNEPYPVPYETDLEKWQKSRSLDLESLPEGTLVYLGDTGTWVNYLIKIEKDGKSKLWINGNSGCYIGTVKSLHSVNGAKGKIDADGGIGFPYFKWGEEGLLNLDNRTPGELWWLQSFPFFRVLYAKDYDYRSRASVDRAASSAGELNNKRIGGQRSGGILEASFAGDVWIRAGGFIYKISIAADTVSFQRYEKDKINPVGRIHTVFLDQQIQVGRETGDYRLPNDMTLSSKHFLFKVSRAEDGKFMLRVEDLKSLNGTVVEWNEPQDFELGDPGKGPGAASRLELPNNKVKEAKELLRKGKMLDARWLLEETIEDYQRIIMDYGGTEGQAAGPFLQAAKKNIMIAQMLLDKILDNKESPIQEAANPGEIGKIETSPDSHADNKKLQQIIAKFEGQIQISQEDVTRYVPEEIKILFEVAKELGLTIVLTGGTARDFAIAAHLKRRLPMPVLSDIDIAIIPEEDSGILGYGDWAKEKYELLNEELRKIGYAYKVDFSAGVRTEDTYVFENFLNTKSNSAFGLSRLAVAWTGSKYIIFGTSEAINDLENKVLSADIEKVEAPGKEMATKMIGKVAIYRDFAGFGMDNYLKESILKDVSLIKGQSKDAIIKFVKDIFDYMKVNDKNDNPTERLRKTIREFDLSGALGFSEEELMKLATGSPSIPEEAKNPGGIDFRVMPIVTQPMQPSLGTVPLGVDISPLTGLPVGQAGTVPANLDKEWQQIQNMLNVGMIPSSERIKEYLQSCSQKQDFSQDIDKILSCIVDILRLEEERVSQADPALKDLLVLLESDKAGSELQLSLAKIIILPAIPKPVNP